jgi:hypothetical protein
MFPLLPVLLLMLVQGSAASGGSLDPVRIHWALQAVQIASHAERDGDSAEFESEEARALAKAWFLLQTRQAESPQIAPTESAVPVPQNQPTSGVPNGFGTAWNDRAGPRA